MKKLLLFLGVISAAQFSFAQITLTNSNTAAQGVSFFRAEEENPPVGLSYINAGADQTWDFSMFLAYPETFHEVQVKEPNSVAIHGASFPTADIAVYSTLDENNIFMENQSSGLVAIGLGGYFVIPQYALALEATLPFIDPQQLLIYPCTYQTSFDDTLFFDLFKDTLPELGGFADSARIKRIQFIESEIDAWGTVTIPSGTHNCLREKRVEISVDSLWASVPQPPISFDSVAFARIDTELVYNWYTEDYNLPLVEIRTKNNGEINSIYFRSAQSECCVDVEENELAVKFNVYPNPASDMITVLTTYTDQAFISMFDMTGKEVLSESISQPQNQFDVSNLSNGMYLYRIQDAKGKLIKAEKIMVQK